MKEDITDGIIDFLVVGDGELQLLEIIKMVSLSGGRSSEKLCHEDDFIRSEVVADLDVLPLPYKLSPTLVSDLKRTGLGFIESTRGCPFDCSYCDQGLRVVRMRSVELVEEDLMFLYQNGAKKVVFFDSTFNLKRSRMMRLLD
jgi:radical SAM superfamily enzyme YgiQ (UPF0313 family)